MVLKGADFLTEGAAALARRVNVPEIVIGLTIVAAGTSAPELFVSLVSALKGTPDLAVGNVVGSNTMNCMLIVGCAAMVAPMTISRSTVKKDIPFAVGASVVLMLLALNGFLGRFDGIVLLAGFALFMVYSLRQAKNGQGDTPTEEKQQNPWLSLLFIVLGLVGLVIGSNLFVDHASSLALALGISEGVGHCHWQRHWLERFQYPFDIGSYGHHQSPANRRHHHHRYGSDAHFRYPRMAVLLHALYR